ncbi:hypothetical protein [Streptomyces liliifuscus]|uniref:Uncharacterized protein n=1 Tax=Streptomyces liliifuscus TaxID=2797636 RepID=A0A7T7RFX4_9ACTN|nr:hypothetical protein [Streptomyces liliifuscus]QQM45134.1 hypothetical protein JEQ17_40885 [Streptomyces liliifuscus]
MTNDPTTDPLRIPITRSVTYAARGLPDLPFLHGPGVIKPYEITLTYRAAPDSQLGRVHAYVKGRLWADGREVFLADGYGQHYDDGLDGWPEWLAAEARLHDPDAASVPSAPTQTADADRRARYAQAIRDTDGWVLDDGQHMLDAVLAVADAEQATIRAAALREAADHLARQMALASPATRDVIAADVAELRRLAAVPAAVEEQPQCDVEFEGGGHCAKPAGHRPPGSQDPHIPAVEEQPGAQPHSAATVASDMCPRCKGGNSESWALCDTCAPDRLRCPRCREDLTDYDEDDFVYLTGDVRPYCSGECVVATHRAALKTQPAAVAQPGKEN